MKRKRNAITAKKIVRLTPAQERVQIAADALAQIKLKTFQAQTGMYVALPDIINTDGDTSLNAKKVVECLITDKTPCTVCAKGALFISTVRRSNEQKFTVQDLVEAEYDPSTNIDAFEQDQLDLIESYFEGSPNGDYFIDDTIEEEITKEDHCERFSYKNPDPNKRLIKILQNIINNEGEFIPSKLR